MVPAAPESAGFAAIKSLLRVVEDDAANRQMPARRLQRTGHEVRHGGQRRRGAAKPARRPAPGSRGASTPHFKKSTLPGDAFRLEPRGKAAIRGLGEMETWTRHASMLD